MWKREETPFKTDCFKWPAVSSGAALYPGLKLTPFVLHSFFNPYTLPATSNASSWRRCFDQDMTGKVCYSPCYSLVTRGVLPGHKWKLLLSVTESGRDLRLPLFSSPYLLLRHHITLSLSLTSSPFLFLSPSGDLRIGLVWDNLTIHPIQSHNLVWVLKSCSNWTKSSIPLCLLLKHHFPCVSLLLPHIFASSPPSSNPSLPMLWYQ